MILGSWPIWSCVKVVFVWAAITVSSTLSEAVLKTCEGLELSNILTGPITMNLLLVAAELIAAKISGFCKIFAKPAAVLLSTEPSCPVLLANTPCTFESRIIFDWLPLASCNVVKRFPVLSVSPVPWISTSTTWSKLTFWFWLAPANWLSGIFTIPSTWTSVPLSPPFRATDERSPRPFSRPIFWLSWSIPLVTSIFCISPKTYCPVPIFSCLDCCSIAR